MNITVNNERTQQVEQIQFSGSTVEELLRRLQLNPEAVLVVRDGVVIPETELLQDNDALEILSVVSGG